MRVFVFFALLSLSFSTQTAGEYDEMLDPGKITYWKESWSPSPIILSQTHTSSTSKMTIYYRPTTTIAQGHLEVIFPSGVIHSSLVNGKFSATASVQGGVDSTFEIHDVSVLSKGAYGPFGLITRHSSTGQIIDMNLAFSSIYILDEVVEYSGLVVSSGSGNKQGDILSTDSLAFTFDTAKSIWKYDLIVISISEYFTPSDAVVCTSVSVDGYENLVFGPDENRLHDLPCVVDQGEIVIYGISQDITVPAAYRVSLKIESFTLPSAVHILNYKWKISHYRFSTDTLTAVFESTNLPFTLKPGSITLIEWEPVRDYSSILYVANLEIFLSIVFSAEHNVPAGGTIEIEFSGVDIESPIWFYTDSNKATPITASCVFSPYTENSSCTVNSQGKLTINIAEQIDLSTVITVTALTDLKSNPKITKISTYNPEHIEIDSLNSGHFSRTLNIPPEYYSLRFSIEADLDGILDTAVDRWFSGDQVDRDFFFIFQPYTD